MPYERRPDRRPGGGRPGGPGRPASDRPYGDRPQRDRPAYGDRPSFGDRPQRDRGEFSSGPPRERTYGAPPARPGGFTPRPMDDGGMSIRLDPRRLGALKLLAAEAGVRPGELVTRWVEERLDSARPGGATAAGAGPSGAVTSVVASDVLATLNTRIDELYRRMDQVTAAATATKGAAGPEVASDAAEAPKRGRGRPAKAVVTARKVPARRKQAVSKVALHEEIAAVITERGPQTAAELATAIVERGLYRAPRSGKELDAATVNARVSNPTYRGRFVRRERRIGLATE